ncbi:MAG: hypothetical protein AAF959_16630 [Cyanobacteria bacterium P01_D01_bin.56]
MGRTLPNCFITAHYLFDDALSLGNTAMYQIGQVKICPLPLQQSNANKPGLLSRSDRNVVMEIPADFTGDLVSYHGQTNQLLATQGNLVVVTLQKQQYNYFALNAQRPALVEIPPDIPYGFINLSSVSCFVFCNSWSCIPDEEQQPRTSKPSSPYDIARVMQLLQEMNPNHIYQPMLRVLK